MSLLGTVRVGNYTDFDRVDTVTAVLSLPATAIRLKNDQGQETNFELSAVGAVTGTTVRVQWHTFGRPSVCPDEHPVGQIPYRKYLRVMFLCEIPANSEKQVSIYLNENQVAPTPFVLDSELTAALTSAGVYIDLAGFHGSSWKFPDTGPQGKCRLCFDLSAFTNGAPGNIIDTWKDPQNAIVRRWRFRTRGYNPDAAGDNQFAYQWWGELDIEIGSSQRVAKCYLRYGPSIIQRDEAIHPWRNPNVMLFSNMPHMYNEGEGPDVYDGAQLLGKRTTGGMTPDEHGVFMTITGPKSAIYMPFCKVFSSVEQATNPLRPSLHNVKYRLINPNQYKPSSPPYTREIFNNASSFCNGQQQLLRFILAAEQGASAAELNTISSLSLDKSWAISEDWAANQNYGVLGHVPPYTHNTAAEARVGCKTMDDDHYALYVADRQNPNLGAMPWGGAAIFCGHNSVNYCTKANQGAGGDQGDFCWTSKLWPWASCAHPRLRAAQFCADMDVQRAMFFRYEDASPLRNINHRVYNPNRYTDLFFWNGRPFQVYNAPGQKNPPDCDLLGTRGEIGEYETPGAQTGFSKEHVSIMTVIHFTVLTGDWMMLQVCRDLEEVVWASFQLPSYGGNRNDGIDNSTNDRSVGRSIMCMLALYDLLFENNQQNTAADWWTVPSYKLYRAAILRYQAYVGSLPVFRTAYYTLNSGPENSQDCRHSVTACNPGDREQFTPWMAGMVVTAEVYIRKVVGTNPVFNLAKHEEMVRAICMQYWIILYQMTPFWCQPRLNCCYPNPPCNPPAPISSTAYGTPAGVAWMPYYISLRLPNRAFGAEVVPSDYGDCSNITLISETEFWSMGAFVLGWDIANRTNDLPFKRRCKELIDIRLDGLTLASRTRGNYGFGRYPQGNADEWSYLVPDLYKNREDGSAVIRATFQGRGTMEARVDSLGGSQHTIDVSFTGTGSTILAATVYYQDTGEGGGGGGGGQKKKGARSEEEHDKRYKNKQPPGVGRDDSIIRISGDGNYGNKPNSSGLLKIVDTENLIKENTLLIHYIVNTTGEWVYSTYDCGYKPVCDEYWYVMHPNHQHPRHTDASPDRPFYVYTGGSYGSFAWNYGGIPGISPVDFDDQHSFLVQLAMVNQGCFHTGGQSGTGVSGMSGVGMTGYTGVTGTKPPDWPKKPGDIKKPGYGEPPYPGIPDWPQMPGTGELVTIIQFPPNAGIGYSETSASPNKPIGSIDLGRTDPISTIGIVRDAIVNKGTTTSSLVPGLNAPFIVKSVLTEGLSPKPPGKAIEIDTKNPINDRPIAWQPINGDKGFSNKEIDNLWSLGGKGNPNVPLAESPKDLYKDSFNTGSYLTINRSINLLPGQRVDAGISVPSLDIIPVSDSNKISTNNLPLNLGLRSERDNTYALQQTKHNIASTSIELGDERVTVELVVSSINLRIGEVLTIASNCIPIKDAEMFVYGKILISDSTNKQIEAGRSLLVKATHDEPAQLAVTVRTDIFTSGPAYVTAVYTDNYGTIVGVKTIRIDLVNKLTESYNIDSYRPIRHDIISDDLARTAGVDKDSYVDITLYNNKILIFNTSNARFGFVITSLEPTESDIAIDAELTTTAAGDVSSYFNTSIFQTLGATIDYVKGPISFNNKGTLANEHLAGLINRAVSSNTITLSIGRTKNITKPIRLRIYTNKEAKLRPVAREFFSNDGTDSWSARFDVPFVKEKYLIFDRGLYSGNMPTSLTGIYAISNVSGSVLFQSQFTLDSLGNTVNPPIPMASGHWLSIMVAPFNYGTDILFTQEIP